jgi:hypothetical protein
MNKVEGGQWYVCCYGFIRVFLLTSGLDCVRYQRDSMIVYGGILNLGSKRVPKLSSAAKKETAKDIMSTQPVSLLI